MYAHIKGKLTYASPLFTILEAGGIGYKIFIPSNLFGELKNIGEECFLYLSFVVREQAHTLYGFRSIEERDLFEMLMNVSGIGPKTALSLIGHLNFEDLLAAIKNEDDKTLCKVPGIGKKTAERLLLEVKDKIKGFARAKNFSQQYSVSMGAFSENDMAYDALSALINLGYREAAAEKAIWKVLSEPKDDLDLAELITLSLKQM